MKTQTYHEFLKYRLFLWPNCPQNTPRDAVAPRSSKKRGFLNSCRSVSPRDGRKRIDPEAVSTADRALAHGRRLGRCRRSDHRRTHDPSREVVTPGPDSAADNGDGTSCPVRSLVTTVSVMSLPPSHFRTAFRTAVALATVATDTDCEHAPASRVTANPKPKNSVLVDVHIGHKEIMASRPGLN